MVSEGTNNFINTVKRRGFISLLTNASSLLTIGLLVGGKERRAQAADQVLPVKPSLNHVALCVSDMVRSALFYTNVLGAEEIASQKNGRELSGFMDLEGVSFETRIFKLGAARFELLKVYEPGDKPAKGIKPMNEMGLTHLSVRVPDLDQTLVLVSKWGGTILQKTRSTVAGKVNLMFVADPDGTRIELVHRI